MVSDSAAESGPTRLLGLRQPLAEDLAPTDRLSRLPQEKLLEILRLLSLTRLARMRAVSRRFRRLASDASLYRRIGQIQLSGSSALRVSFGSPRLSFQFPFPVKLSRVRGCLEFLLRHGANLRCLSGNNLGPAIDDLLTAFLKAHSVRLEALSVTLFSMDKALLNAQHDVAHLSLEGISKQDYASLPPYPRLQHLTCKTPPDHKWLRSLAGQLRSFAVGGERLDARYMGRAPGLAGAEAADSSYVRSGSPAPLAGQVPVGGGRVRLGASAALRRLVGLRRGRL